MIKEELPGLWKEGSPFAKESIYRIIDENTLPPVNYDLIKLKPHSITHCETSLHVDNNGQSINDIFTKNPQYFIGNCLLLKFPDDYNEISNNLFIKKITLSEFLDKLNVMGFLEDFPSKIIFTTEYYPENEFGFHAENYILILADDLADYLSNKAEFHLYGTSWKSTDYQPNKNSRPIHRKLLKHGIVFELLCLNHVPQGNYFFSGIPLNIKGASESPVSPFLINFELLQNSYYLDK